MAAATNIINGEKMRSRSPLSNDFILLIQRLLLEAEESFIMPGQPNTLSLLK